VLVARKALRNTAVSRAPCTRSRWVSPNSFTCRSLLGLHTTPPLRSVPSGATSKPSRPFSRKRRPVLVRVAVARTPRCAGRASATGLESAAIDALALTVLREGRPTVSSATSPDRASP
jgi:hypothetical protein